MGYKRVHVKPQKMTEKFGMTRPRREAAEAGAKSTQLKFRATQELSDQIEEAAKRNGRNASEEIRQRLEQSFSRGDDPKTLQLVTTVTKTAAASERYYSNSWHSDPFTFQIFKTALELVLLTHYRPPGECVPPKSPEVTMASMLYPDDVTPEELGRAVAGEILGELREEKARP